jgi:hypothetical protein
MLKYLQIVRAHRIYQKAITMFKFARYVLADKKKVEWFKKGIIGNKHIDDFKFWEKTDDKLEKAMINYREIHAVP